MSLSLLRHPPARVVNMTLCPLPVSFSLGQREKIKSQPLLRRDQRVTEAVKGLRSPPSTLSAARENKADQTARENHGPLLLFGSVSVSFPFQVNVQDGRIL